MEPSQVDYKSFNFVYTSTKQPQCNTIILSLTMLYTMVLVCVGI